MRFLVSSLALALALVVAQSTHPTPASAVDVNIQLGSGHTVWFDQEPQLTLIPESRVSYMNGPDYELYRYGGWYYMNNGGHWYRSRSLSQPFQRTGYGVVPRQVVQVPVTYHRYNVRVNNRDPWATRWTKVKHNNGNHGRGRGRGR